MADALVMAAEAGPGAIVDIATLTGSVSRAFGTDRRRSRHEHGTDEQVRVWRHGCRRRCGAAAASPYAARFAGRRHHELRPLTACAILSSLFLSEFTGEIPWAHIDIAGTAWADADKGWLGQGCNGLRGAFAVGAGAGISPRLTESVTTPRPRTYGRARCAAPPADAVVSSPEPPTRSVVDGRPT